MGGLAKGLVAAPALLSLVGLLLSLEYKGEKYRVVLRVFQVLAGLVAAASAVSWFVALPRPAEILIMLAAIGANLPLAALGMGKNLE